MVVPIATEPAFRAGSPAVLLESPSWVIAPYTSQPNFDLSPDGETFVMVKESEASGLPTEIRVITDWFEELRRLSPPSRD
jgi:hypothetical protein